ncbi:hypothetical protein, partial [uncultured Bilophila sp.]|uniref:hypothetical protein n=1 Tax=uncultured Bilophila sp. TaxID=529385 RepID=UPI0025CF8684
DEEHHRYPPRRWFRSHKFLKQCQFFGHVFFRYFARSDGETPGHPHSLFPDLLGARRPCSSPFIPGVAQAATPLSSIIWSDALRRFIGITPFRGQLTTTPKEKRRPTSV